MWETDINIEHTDDRSVEVRQCTVVADRESFLKFAGEVWDRANFTPSPPKCHLGHENCRFGESDR